MTKDKVTDQTDLPNCLETTRYQQPCYTMVVDMTWKHCEKTFRVNYANILKSVHGLGQNSIHKKVMYTAEDLRNSSADFDYTEAIDTAIANRKYLLDRLVSVSHT